MEFIIVQATVVLSPLIQNSCAFRQDVSAAVSDDC